ncbi:F-box/LRR-repeat protein 4, partial [Triticum aestivum]|uniref:F-box/LRR-repeat protein 4 n=1 Tax=Triticum aestivum TaxID=4565 RepID=UPI001D01BDE3
GRRAAQFPWRENFTWARRADELRRGRVLPLATAPISPRRGGGGRRAGCGGGACGDVDAALCDDLLQEVFRLLPPAAGPAVSLVSRRWVALLRASTSRLTLRLPPAFTGASASAAAGPLADLLSRYPYLSALAVVSASSAAAHDADALLLAVSASPSATRLTALRFSVGSPVSPAALRDVSVTLSGLTSLHLAAVSPLSFRWLACLPCLKSFAFVNSAVAAVDSAGSSSDEDSSCEGDAVGALPLERLSLCGIRSGDHGLGWLWQRCGSLRWLQLRACDGIGDGPASNAFSGCLAGLLELELRACRTVADRVLLIAADRCCALKSLLVYDGGSREALLQFIRRRGAALHTLDLRLPLDLHNDHLLAIGAEQGHDTRGSLAVLRLQSCVLVTGDGLRSLARTAIGAGIKEVALVSCDVVEREPGLLTFLSQSMRHLRRLDLSYNETLKDKEIGAMLSSCRNLIDIRFRGCRGITGESLLSLLRHCGQTVEVVDISRCPAIKGASVELFAQRAARLNHLVIEESLVSEELKAIARTKRMEVGPLPCEGSF